MLASNWYKLRKHFRNIALIGLVLPILASCTSIGFPIITPVFPLPTVDNHYPKTNSSQPTFQWEAVPEADSYDFVIYESLEANYMEGLYHRSTSLMGKRVYFLEGIKHTQHTVEKPLETGRKYLWSVRARQNDRVTPWAKYNFSGIGASGTNILFGFETP